MVPSKCYCFLEGARADSKKRLCARHTAAIVAGIAPGLLVVSAVLDGTLRMNEADGVGLIQHYGFWVIFASTPLLILLAGHLLDVFHELMGDIDQYVSSSASRLEREQLGKLIGSEMKSLALNGRSRFILYFGVVVGLLYLQLNVAKTVFPVSTYGHDVFDSWSHRLGFFAAKIYLTPIFIAVYPFVIFIGSHITWSMTRVLRFLCDKGVLEINFFHQDRCGGTSRFGYINLQVMLANALLFSVLVGMFLTHQRTYFVTRSALLFCSVLAVLQSLIGVYSVHRFVKQRRDECARKIEEELGDSLKRTLRRESAFSGDLLKLHRHVLAIRSFPYAPRVKILVNTLRFAPAAIAILSLVSGGSLEGAPPKSMPTHEQGHSKKERS